MKTCLVGEAKFFDVVKAPRVTIVQKIQLQDHDGEPLSEV